MTDPWPRGGIVVLRPWGSRSARSADRASRARDMRLAVESFMTNKSRHVESRLGNRACVSDLTSA